MAKRILYPSLFVVFVFLMSVALSPLYKLKEFEKLVKNDSLFIAKYDKNWSHSEFSEMVKEKTYKEALLKLAGKDSVQLAINLADSTVCLYINGVKIHKTVIKLFEQAKLLKKIPTMQYVKIFSQPLNISSQFATIVKEPVVIRQAPKDTIEAALNAWEPDTLLQNPAFLLLRLEHGIDLVFEQESNPVFYDKWIKFRFFNELWANKTLNALFCFFTFKKQEYYPVITIKIPANELRAIYRALPQNAFVVLKI
ncbi:MAG: hypothetical protein H8E34_10155 [Bacteroidetes bacterium]|nr:hypothetical protein [Bacteroidota bacterium]MBL6944503.1 hypothetical protein [Bacteroidales bacterium]